ncbi:MAG: 1,4-beta-xylanase [Micavibrio sp.]|nr:1,4-beta-xylanase [Micavibrio sp.]
MSTSAIPSNQWSPDQAKQWYARQPFLIGANFLPANAINQLEMWQADTFDPRQIDWELGLAEDHCGMTTMRIFLHDLLWDSDSDGYKQRIDTVLGLCEKHKIKPMLVLFDSCWDPHPKLGKQKDPMPHTHNSGWVQSPGAKALADAAEHPRLENYIKGIVGAFANDDRILAWDVWNEPDFINHDNYGQGGLGVELPPDEKRAHVAKLIPQVFDWVRSAGPVQPLTSGIWTGDWSSHDKLNPIQKTQIEKSDLISFHSYGKPEVFEGCVQALQRYERPFICTEYMARSIGSTFECILPLARKFNVAVLNWGLVVGKSQTHLPWRNWSQPTQSPPAGNLFHDIFWSDGTPIDPAELPVFKYK